MKNSTIIIAMLGAGWTLACEEEPTAAEASVDAATAEAKLAPTPDLTAAPEPSADDELSEMEKRAEEEAEAQAKLAENPLTECCRALGQKAFKMRSPEYHGASKACGEALTAEQDDLSAILPTIKKALKDQPLPSECSE